MREVKVQGSERADAQEGAMLGVLRFKRRQSGWNRVRKSRDRGRVPLRGSAGKSEETRFSR